MKSSLLHVYLGVLVLVTAFFVASCGDSSNTCEPCSNGDVDVIDGDMESAELDAKAIPRIVVDKELDFGAVLLGLSSTRELIIHSAGTAPLKIINVKLNTSTDEFVLDSAPEDNTELMPDNEVAVVVTYTPKDPGTDTATIDIYSNDPDSPLIQVELVTAYKGRARLEIELPTQEPVAHINSDEITISVSLHTQTDELDDNRVITVSNISLENSEHFSLDRTSFSLPILVPPRQAREIKIKFHPKAVGELSAKLSVECDSDYETNVDASVKGIGAIRQLSVSPQNGIDFGVLPVDSSGTRELTLFVEDGLGHLPVEVSNISIEGDDQFQLDEPPSLPFTITPGEESVIKVKYSPDAIEGNTATVVISSNSFQSNEVRVPVSGRGAEKTLQPNKSYIDFGDVCLGNSATDTLTLSDTGMLGAHINSIVPADTAIGFSISGIQFPVDVDPQGDLQMQIDFTPISVGEVQTQLVIDADAALTSSVVLRANGVSAGLDISPDGTEDEPVSLGTIHALDSASQTFTVTNSGVCELIISEISLSEGSDPRFVLNGLPAQFPVTVSAGEDVSFEVSFDPQGSVGEGFAAVMISSNLGEKSVSLYANAVYPRMDISPPEGADFGSWHAGAASDEVTITLRSVGVGALVISQMELVGDDASAFALTGLPTHFPLTLDSGDSIQITGILNTSQVHDYEATLRIQTNDRSQPELEYRLYGAGVECPPNYYDCDSDPRTCEYFCIVNGDEICDGRDNDCNCIADDPFPEVGNPCTADGVCGVGTYECSESDPSKVVCSTAPGGSEDKSSEEICDGLDNDCDGETDEGFNVGESCDGVGECGIGYIYCKPDGTSGCSTDIGGPESGVQPELCDGKDNDCDGEVDEGFDVGTACSGTGTCGIGVVECDGLLRVRCSTDPGGSEDESEPELCDGLDNDCDGYVDEDFNIGVQCDGLGQCGIGHIECNGLHDTRCSTDLGGSEYDPHDPQRIELCDGLDNDCDGEADENFFVGDPCDGVGECGAGTIECADIYTARCSTDPGGSEYVFHQEVCDGLDNDCDGFVDEDYGIGQSCMGVGRCGAGVWECNGLYSRVCSTMPGGSNSQAQPETCNGIDDDCNGTIDDPFHTDPNDSDFFCLALGDCGWGHMECVDANSSICSTEPGGSQYPGYPEVCDGHDNDCDGYVDEDFHVGSSCDGIGECGIGRWECVPGAGTRRCSTEPGGSDAAGPDGPKAEDGFGVDFKDNDCNGTPDDPWMQNIYRYVRTSGSDVDHILTPDTSTPSGFTAEGAKFALYSSVQSNTHEVFAFRSPSNDDYIYTIDSTEASSLIGDGWTQLDSIGYAMSYAGYETLPVYRLYNATASDHVFVVSDSEREQLESAGYTNEGIVFYAWQPMNN